MVREKKPGGRYATYEPITITHPIVAAEWHSTLNFPVLPEDVTQGVEENYWWHGTLCGHDWPASPYNRTHGKNGGTGCSICTHKWIVPEINSLQAEYPLISAEWDYELNDTTPNLIAPGENRKLRWWSCKDAEHPSYPATVTNRTSLGRGCPYCAGRYPVPGKTDLPTMRPHLMPEWDYENNTRAPETCMVGTDYSAGWKCVLKGHTWRTQVKVRALAGAGCPKCYRSESKAEAELQQFLQSIYVNEISTKNRKLLGNTQEVDIYLPQEKLAIEYNGLYYHSVEFGTNKTKLYHANKYEFAEAQGLQLVHVWEDDWFKAKPFIKKLFRARLNTGKVATTRLTAKWLTAEEGSAFVSAHGVFVCTLATTWVGIFKKQELVGVLALSGTVAGEYTVTNFVFTQGDLRAVFPTAMRKVKELLRHETLHFMLEQGSTLLLISAHGFIKTSSSVAPSLLPVDKVRMTDAIEGKAKFHIWDAGHVFYMV